MATSTPVRRAPVQSWQAYRRYRLARYRRRRLRAHSRWQRLLAAHVLGTALGLILLTGCGSDGEPAADATSPPAVASENTRGPATQGGGHGGGMPGTIPAPNEVRPDASVVDLAPRRWNRVEPAPDGRSLTLYVTLGKAPCSVLGRVDTAETAAAVTVTLQVGRLPDADCSGPQPPVAGLRMVTVQLGSPLGDRTVVDGAA